MRQGDAARGRRRSEAVVALGTPTCRRSPARARARRRWPAAPRRMAAAIPPTPAPTTTTSARSATARQRPRRPRRRTEHRRAADDGHHGSPKKARNPSVSITPITAYSPTSSPVGRRRRSSRSSTAITPAPAAASRRSCDRGMPRYRPRRPTSSSPRRHLRVEEEVPRRQRGGPEHDAARRCRRAAERGVGRLARRHRHRQPGQRHGDGHPGDAGPQPSGVAVPAERPAGRDCRRARPHAVVAPTTPRPPRYRAPAPPAGRGRASWWRQAGDHGARPDAGAAPTAAAGQRGGDHRRRRRRRRRAAADERAGRRRRTVIDRSERGGGRRRPPCASVGTRARRRTRRSPRLDAVEDPAVEDAGGADAAGRARRQHGDAERRPDVQRRGSARSRSASARRTPACTRRVGEVGPEPPQVLLGQVHPARSRSSPTSRRKFVSWKASPRPARRGGGAGSTRLEDRQHHLADHRGRAVHVAAQVVPRLVALDGEVHRPSSAGSGRKQSGSMSKARTVWTTALSTGRRTAAVEVGEEPVAEVGQRGGRARRRGVRRAEVVDDVVGVAAEPVQGVDVVALHRRQQEGRPVVGRAVAPVQRRHSA